MIFTYKVTTRTDLVQRFPGAHPQSSAESDGADSFSEKLMIQ